jgi:uncharacterized tellurite resistance protein B-like protein
MLGKLKSLFTRVETNGGADSSGPNDHHIAAAALLIEAAMTDGAFEDVERDRIAVLVERQFGVPKEEAARIIARGEGKAENAVDIYSFLRVIVDNFDHDERVRLVEMLWEVALADGVIHEHEDTLVRRVCGMLGVTDRESGAARKRVRDRMASTPEDSDAIHPINDVDRG